MTQFKVGDRVRYTGARSLQEDGKHLSPGDVGKTGIISDRKIDGLAGGEWDDGSYWAGYYDGNLELIQPTLTATDRLGRLEAFVARLATGLVGNDIVVDDARALVAEIAPPADPIEAFITELMAQDLPEREKLAKAYEAGKTDG